MFQRVMRMVAVGAVATSIAACGGSSTGGGTSLNLEAKDYVFSPTNLSAAAGTVTVTFTNSGTKQHNLTIEDGVEKKVNQDLDPGKTVTVTFKLTGSGSVAFHCEYHQALKDPSNGNKGMVGTFNGSGGS